MSTKTEGDPRNGELPEWGAVCEVIFMGSIKNECLYFGNGKWAGTEGRVYYSDHVTHWRLIPRDPIGETVIPGIAAARTIAELQAKLNRCSQDFPEIVKSVNEVWAEVAEQRDAKIAEQAAEIERLRSDNKRHLDLIFNMYHAAGMIQGGDELEAVRRCAKERDTARANLSEKESHLVTVYIDIKESLDALGVDTSVDGYVPDSWTLVEQCRRVAEDRKQYVSAKTHNAIVAELRAELARLKSSEVSTEVHTFGERLPEEGRIIEVNFNGVWVVCRDYGEGCANHEWQWRPAILPIDSDKAQAIRDDERRKLFDELKAGARSLFGIDADTESVLEEIARHLNNAEPPIGTSEPEQRQSITTGHPLSGAVAVDDEKPSDSTQCAWCSRTKSEHRKIDGLCPGTTSSYFTELAAKPSDSAAVALLRKWREEFELTDSELAEIDAVLSQPDSACERCERLENAIGEFNDAIIAIIESDGTT